MSTIFIQLVDLIFIRRALKTSMHLCLWLRKLIVSSTPTVASREIQRWHLFSERNILLHCGTRIWWEYRHRISFWSKWPLTLVYAYTYSHFFPRCLVQFSSFLPISEEIMTYFPVCVGVSFYLPLLSPLPLFYIFWLPSLVSLITLGSLVL